MGIVAIVSFISLLGTSAHIIRAQEKLERMSLMDNTIDEGVMAEDIAA